MARSDEKVSTETPPRQVTPFVPQPWNIITPRVYRYEDQQWVDAFFDNGLIRLSSFTQCRAYEDEHRGDAQEAFGTSYIEMLDGTSVAAVFSQGSDAYLLCCTHNLDRSLQQAFKRDSAFKIMDPMAFSLSIAAVLPDFAGGFEGSCIYRDHNIRRKGDFTMEQFRRSDGTVDMAFLQWTLAVGGGPERMLLKRKRYAPQQEYRMVWGTRGDAAPYIDIQCPDARQFCARVDDWEW